MNNINHDQVSHTFIEGQVISKPDSHNFQEDIAGKAAEKTDLTQGFELEVDVNANIYNEDKPYYYDANERYD